MTAENITVRPIYASDLDRVAPACWQSRSAQLELLARQETLGFAAWQEDTCVGSLHCYRVALPDYDDALFPAYGRDEPRSWPLGWPLLAARGLGLAFERPVWGLACFHVGFTGPSARRADPGYFRRGIGRALLESAISWAERRGYGAVLAHGGPDQMPRYNTNMGCLPYTAYLKHGFSEIARDAQPGELGWFAAQKGDPQMEAEISQALAAGTAPEALSARAMLLVIPG